VKKILICLSVTAVCVAGPALATAKVPAPGDTRALLIRAIFGANSHGATGCFTTFLASPHSTWAIAAAPSSDGHKPECAQIQPGGFTILHYNNQRWHTVSAGDEVMCPFGSDPEQPIIPSGVLWQLTGTECVQGGVFKDVAALQRSIGVQVAHDEHARTRGTRCYFSKVVRPVPRRLVQRFLARRSH
jgi:hypothetical protein